MKKLILIPILVISLQSIFAQQPATNKPLFEKRTFGDSVDNGALLYKTRLPQALIVPGILIGAGFLAMDNPLYDRFDAKRDIRQIFGGFGSRVDDYLIFAPYVEFGALLLLKVQCKNDMVNTLLLIGKSELIMGAIVWPMKYLTHVERPDGSNTESFPSGHTAQAFVAATIVHREYRYKSNWYGAGAYAIAGSVAVFRMINNKHWLSDVLVGAGVGMLSANLVYATHIHRWGRKEVCVIPTFDGSNKGVAMLYKF